MGDVYRLRKISPSGIITTVAGNGTYPYSVSNGPAASMPVDPQAIAVDGHGNIFFSELTNTIRKISPDGMIATVAGNGTAGYAGDGGPAGSAEFRNPVGIAFDGQGNLFVADLSNNRVRKISADGIVTTVAGNGAPGFSGDGGPATSAQLNAPASVAVDAGGNLFIADVSNSRVRKVSADGTIATVAGKGGYPYSGEGGPATNAGLSPRAVAVDAQGTLYIADELNSRVLAISPDGIIKTVAGNGLAGFSGEGGRATSAQLVSTFDVAVDGQGNLFLPDYSSNVVRKVSPKGIITTVAGGGTGAVGDGGPATNARLMQPYGVAVDQQGDLFIGEDYRIRKVSPDGTITTVAGTGAPGFSGDGGPATSARLIDPAGLVVDAKGNLFFTDRGNVRIREVSAQGIITTVAGNGKSGFSGDGGPAISAQLNVPYGLAVDGQGNLFIADSYNYRVRKVDPSGTITTVAGDGNSGYTYNGTYPISSGDGGPATSAHLSDAWGVAVDGQGNLLFTEESNHRIRKVSPKGIISTVAGRGTSGYSGDGGPALSAQLNDPLGIAVDGQGSVYIADSNSAVRRLQPVSQSVLIGAVVDAASQQAGAMTPGKIVVVYGSGLGPSALAMNAPVAGMYSNQFAGTTVLFDGTAAPVLYTSASQVAAIVPYGITGATTQASVSYQGETSPPVTLPVAAVAPSLFTTNQTGAGQAAAVNAADGSINDAAHPVKAGGYISLFATGEGQTSPAGADGKLASTPLLPLPNQNVSVTVGGLPAVVQYAGAAPGEVAGVMQVNVQVPAGVQPGGYVPVVLQVGTASAVAGAVWISVAQNQQTLIENLDDVTMAHRRSHHHSSSAIMHLNCESAETVPSHRRNWPADPVCYHRWSNGPEASSDHRDYRAGRFVPCGVAAFQGL